MGSTMRYPDIDPTALRSFLQAHGWRLVEAALPFRQYAFCNDRFQRRELIFPMDVDAPDYKDSVRSVLEKFAEMTGRSLLGVFSSVAHVKSDVIRVRIFGRSEEFDIPLNFASELIPSAEKMIKAAACTVLRPRVHHPRLTLTEANQLVERSRFGQTEEGSFILKVSCPLDALDDQGSLGLSDNEAPFVRQVTHSLWKGLTGMVDAIERDCLDAFVDSLKTSLHPDLSSNLCEAVYAMHDSQLDNAVDFSIECSALNRVGISDLGRIIRIQRDYFSRIEDIRRELRAVESHRDDTFIGTVERLDGEVGTDGRRSGAVILSVMIPGELETVRTRVNLSAEDYVKADRAHMNSGKFVVVAGRLRPGRQPRALTDISRFELLEGTY